MAGSSGWDPSRIDILSSMEAGSAWLQHYVQVDPMLKEPLELYGDRVRRRPYVDTLLRHLGLEHRLITADLADATYELVYPMLDRLADARSSRRIVPTERARGIVQGWKGDERLDSVAAAQAVLDFGWGHLYVEGGEVREVLRAIRGVYVDQMAGRVLVLLRRWQERGWITNSA